MKTGDRSQEKTRMISPMEPDAAARLAGFTNN
jgi:hypothetical protein